MTYQQHRVGLNTSMSVASRSGEPPRLFEVPEPDRPGHIDVDQRAA